MIIFCDYCGRSFEIKDDELDAWVVLDPSDGSKVVICPSCENGVVADGDVCEHELDTDEIGQFCIKCSERL